eukprot:CAMPEP_0168464650 /NCGR_PEP_ID=MMETSP0228-20121227/55689_1 /TAXON_ID=133427 /ORGANISM="Protoceratium reticulatum, Strain CCCM 535 (=CCMP 1889)" /LENGTH=225 /DNA_ID=CAMNT_0008480161 /DNA_START=99 /DNA_END=774 /DNA_ORIENTATION=+
MVPRSRRTEPPRHESDARRAVARPPDDRAREPENDKGREQPAVKAEALRPAPERSALRSSASGFLEVVGSSRQRKPESPPRGSGSQAASSSSAPAQPLDEPARPAPEVTAAEQGEKSAPVKRAVRGRGAARFADGDAAALRALDPGEEASNRIDDGSPRRGGALASSRPPPRRPASQGGRARAGGQGRGGSRGRSPTDRGLGDGAAAGAGAGAGGPAAGAAAGGA